MEIRPLTEELAEVARVELNEDPKRLQESLLSLKDWIRKQPHLRARTDDQWLIAFLRGSKFSLEKAKEKIDIYYSLRSTAPDLFCLNHSDPKVMDILDTGVALVLPKVASPGAPRVVLIRPGGYDPEKYSVMEIVAVTAIQQKICYLEDDNVVISGSVNIMDLGGTKMVHFIRMTPIQMKKIVALNQSGGSAMANLYDIGLSVTTLFNLCEQYDMTLNKFGIMDLCPCPCLCIVSLCMCQNCGSDAAPTRMKAVHFLNMPPFFDTIFNLAKSFLNEKNKQRLHVHNNNSMSLHEYVPQNILPIEYGGCDYSLQDAKDYWKRKFQQYHGWLEEDMQYGTDESKRSGKSKASGLMFGVQGSFRQLELD